MNVSKSFVEKPGDFNKILIFVDVLSRKVWCYLMIGSKMDMILEMFWKLKKSVGKINSITADDEFSAEKFVNICKV